LKKKAKKSLIICCCSKSGKRQIWKGGFFFIKNRKWGEGIGTLKNEKQEAREIRKISQSRKK